LKDNLFAGIDIGAGTTKAVTLQSSEVVSYCISPTGGDAARAGRRVFQRALKGAGATLNDLGYVVSTGYGRDVVPFRDKSITEITCHARGASFLFADCKTVIDIGCQDSKVIKLDKGGRVTNFVMNDKCAAGTGRFIEVMAHALRLKLEEVGAEALRSLNPCSISSTCTVFAESEVVSLRGQGRKREDIIAGVLQALAKRVAILAAGINPEERVVFTGGVAKNIGVRRALEKELGMEMFVPEEPQIIGALGAALLAEAAFHRQ